MRNFSGSSIERERDRPIRKSWTESQPAKNSEHAEEIQLGDDKLNTVTTIKYMGSIFASNGGAESDINNRVKLVRIKKMGRMTGVLCDKKVPIKLKDNEQSVGGGQKERSEQIAYSGNEDATMDKG